jgi:hypothetical protein
LNARRILRRNQQKEGETMTEQKVSRRDALKILASLGGAVTLAGLPKGWKTPVVDVGVLPAHAQVSVLPTATPTATPEPSVPLTVRASWDMPEDSVDIDLMVWDPGGTGKQVDWINTVGPTATHSGDNIAYAPARNWEEVTVPEGGAADGVYRVWVHAHEEFDVEVTVEITANGTQTFVVTVPANIVDTPVAEITYPGGTITSWAGPVPDVVRAAEGK